MQKSPALCEAAPPSANQQSDCSPSLDNTATGITMTRNVLSHIRGH